MHDCTHVNSLVDQEMHKLIHQGIKGHELDHSLKQFYEKHSCKHSDSHSHPHSHPDSHKDKHSDSHKDKHSEIVVEQKKKPVLSVSEKQNKRIQMIMIAALLFFLFIPFFCIAIWYGNGYKNSPLEKKREQGKILVVMGGIGIALDLLGIIYLLIIQRHKMIILGIISFIWIFLFFTFVSTLVTQ